MAFRVFGNKASDRQVNAVINNVSYGTTDNGFTYEHILTGTQEDALPDTVIVTVSDGLTSRTQTVYNPNPTEVEGGPTFGTITLSGNQLEVNWASNKVGRKFDVHLGSDPQPSDDSSTSNDLGDSVDIGEVEQHIFTISRTGSYTAYLRIRYSDNDWADTPTTVAEGRYIDTAVAIDIAVSSYSNVVDLSGSLVAQGSWTEAKWIEVMGGMEKAYTPTNMDHLSLVNDDGSRWIRQRHEAASNGSDRVIGPFKVTPVTDYMRVTQTIMVAPNFTWGSTATEHTGKLGFGIGCGNNTDGGVYDPAGATLRPAWDDGELTIYSYAANRNNGGNFDYGEEIPTGFLIQKGVSFVLDIEAQMNSSTSAADGWLKVRVNGNLLIDKTGIAWMTSGSLGFNRLQWSQFHGGNGPEWSPVETTYAQVKDISWTT